MTLTIALGLLLVAALVRAQQQTKTLGLRLGTQQYENQNWQLLDQAVCLHAGGLTPCTIGGTGSLIQAATAPFVCAATTGGLYVDTDCAQLCRCNPGQAQWCRSDTGACGSATDCCLSTTPTTTTTTLVTTTTTTLAPTTTTTTTGPTTTTSSTTTTTTSSTTTTTAATGAAPSWVPSMLAAWMLDEVSGTRVNAQGTTARDLTVIGSSDPASSSDRMEGALSMSITPSQSRNTVDTFPTLVSPVSTGCWVKAAPQDQAFVMHNWQQVTGTFQLRRDTTATKGFQFDVWDSGSTRTTAVSASSWPSTTWAHVVGTMLSGGTVKVYVNGVLSGSVPMGTAAAQNQAFYLSDNAGFNGLIDECFLANLELSAVDVCRICSCGVRGEQCTCTGTAYTSTGRNASACGSCTLPATCNQATP